jgi:hypothetical protein
MLRRAARRPSPRLDFFFGERPEKAAPPNPIRRWDRAALTATALRLPHWRLHSEK